MKLKVLIISVLLISIIGGCSSDKVTTPEPGRLIGKVTIDGEGVSGVEVTISAYNISGKRSSSKIQPFSKITDIGDYSFELYAGIYRADYVYYDYSGEVLRTARYPIEIISDAQTVIDVELKDPVPHSFLASDGDASVDLSWESAYGASFYRLYRSGSANGHFNVIDQVDTDDGTIYYMDNPPDIGIYYYRVTSVDSMSIESGYESTREVNFTATILPPTGLSALDMVDYVELRWVSKPQAVRYKLFRSKDNENSWTFIDSIPGNIDVYADTPLDTALYYYRLTSVSSYDTESLPGPSISVHYDMRFDPPQGLIIIDQGSNLYLIWQSYSNISYYSVYRSDNPNGDFVLLDSTTNTYYSDTPVDTGIFYYYITVTSPNGRESDPSDIVSAHFDRILDYPSNFQAENMGLYVALTWNEVDWAAAYVIYILHSDSIYYEYAGRVAGSVTSFNDSPLDSALYYYKIATETIDGVLGRKSNPVSVLFTNNLLTPENVYAENMGTFISIHWNTVSGAEGYYIYRAQSEGGSFEYIDSTFNDYYNDIPIEQGSYYYKVKAFDFAGHISAFSNTAYAYFDGIPLPPHNVTAMDSIYKVLLSWESIETDGLFLIYRSTISDSNYIQVGVSPQLQATDWPSQSDRYYYKIRVIVEGDTSGLSDFGTVYFTGVLDVPTNLSAYDAGSDVHLEWTETNGASYYKIYRKLESEPQYQWVLTVPGTYASDQPVVEGTYFYKVKAFTQGDLGSPYSNPVQVYFEP